MSVSGVAPGQSVRETLCPPAMSPSPAGHHRPGPPVQAQDVAPPCPTFVVVPDADAPDAAQAPLRGDLEHVQAVAVEGVVPIQVSVATFIVHPVQGDAHVGRGTCREGRGSLSEAHPRCSRSPALPVTALSTNPAPEHKLCACLLLGKIQNKVMDPGRQQKDPSKGPTRQERVRSEEQFLPLQPQPSQG